MSEHPVSLAGEPAVNVEQARVFGLAPDEYRKIQEIIGRTPTYTELGVFSVMWSEHCSYKSSRIHLRRLPSKSELVVQGPGENAGAIDVGDGWAAVFKIESHNHPSFVEPYQGAATGVGGILRDIFTMGARPVASMNSLKFGSFDHPRTRFLLGGVVGGIGGYGNCVGVPTVAGEVMFDAAYNANILENGLQLGLAPALRDDQHALLRFGEQNFVRRQIRLAQRHQIEIELDPKATMRRHLARRRGESRRAHVLNGDDRAGLARFEARLD